ncbi:hypothetical protein K788_0000419 [Paraburkholderia caribensis MBA4]|uniref:Uncharacterized protein n=2 Tax=Paraburkholderia caribensis TaxID=75105 RepID=A0A0N7JV89_9BURK|nr:hypothetical protein K788_0000419 [Paraburkholderia caribensis MBA4]
MQHLVYVTNVPSAVVPEIREFLACEYAHTRTPIATVPVWRGRSMPLAEVMFAIKKFTLPFTRAHQRAIVLIEGAQNVRDTRRFIGELGLADHGLASIVVIGTSNAIPTPGACPRTLSESLLEFRCAWNEGRLRNMAYSNIEEAVIPCVGATGSAVLCMRYGHCLQQDEDRLIRYITDSMLEPGHRPLAAIEAIVHASCGSVRAMVALVNRLKLELALLKDEPLVLDRFVVRMQRYARLMSSDGFEESRHASMRWALDLHWTMFYETLKFLSD